MVRRKTLSRAALTLLVAVPLFTACEDETTNPPTPTAPLFARYVAIGNSLTAGFQSGGINDSTQMQSYTVQLAEAFDTDFNLPLLNKPGCPAPYTYIFTQQRLGGGGSTDCAVRMSPIPEWINNVAVPGAAVIDVLYNLAPDSDPNTLTSFILGGRTQFEAAKAIHPTFVSVAIGSNDILGALLDGSNPGDPALVTSPADFAARYEEMMDSLTALPSVEGGVLIGLQPIFVDAGMTTLSAPFFSAGGAWMQFEAFFDGQSAPHNFFDVDAATCATAFVPFAVAAPMLSVANARVDSVQSGLIPPGGQVVVTLTCTDNLAITAAELGNVIAAHTAFNATIQQEATDRGWAYFDPAAVFTGMAGTPGAFRPFPAFDPTDPQNATMPFGFAVSIDGVHWSATLHDALATAMIAAIETHY